MHEFNGTESNCISIFCISINCIRMQLLRFNISGLIFHSYILRDKCNSTKDNKCFFKCFFRHDSLKVLGNTSASCFALTLRTQIHMYLAIF